MPAFPPAPSEQPGFAPAGGYAASSRGGASGSATVPTVNRAWPPAGEIPQFTPAPRVYQASDLSPAPPLPTRTPAEPPPARPGAQPPPLAPPLPPPPAAGAPPVDTRPPQRAPRPRQPGLPVYSDLLGPAPEAAPAAQPGSPVGASAATQYAPAPAVQAGRPGEPSGLWQAPPPAPDAAGQPAPPPPFGGPPAPGAPQPQPHPEQVEAPAAGVEPPEGRSGPPVGVIVGAVLAGAAVLVFGALSIPFLLERLNPPPTTTSLSVGDCVTQDGSGARLVECTEPGAFEIVSRVEARDECGDPTQPAVEVAGPPVRFFCLTPVATAGPESE